jgi:hypothetical protein
LSSRQKLKLTLLTLESTALYFGVGFFIALAMDWRSFLSFLLPLTLATAIFETLFWKNFVFMFDGEDVGELARFNVFIQTLVDAVLWLLAGYGFGRVYLLEVLRG